MSPRSSDIIILGLVLGIIVWCIAKVVYISTYEYKEKDAPISVISDSFKKYKEVKVAND